MMARPIPIGGKSISLLFMKNRYTWVHTAHLHKSFKKYQTKEPFDLPPLLYCRTLHFCYSEWLHVCGIFWHSKILYQRWNLRLHFSISSWFFFAYLLEHDYWLPMMREFTIRFQPITSFWMTSIKVHEGPWWPT